jgi:hypothetical protein
VIALDEVTGDGVEALRARIPGPVPQLRA